MAILHQLSDNAFLIRKRAMNLRANPLVDARQLYCPEPLMLLHNAVRDARAGETIELVATDPSTERDVSKFCHFLGHKLLKTAQNGDEFRFWIEKKAAD